jgi:hypothetical protein
LSLRTSFFKVQLGLVCGKFELAYILATESFYKIQARPVTVYNVRFLNLHTSFY